MRYKNWKEIQSQVPKDLPILSYLSFEQKTANKFEKYAKKMIQKDRKFARYYRGRVQNEFYFAHETEASKKIFLKAVEIMMMRTNNFKVVT